MQRIQISQWPGNRKFLIRTEPRLLNSLHRLKNVRTIVAVNLADHIMPAIPRPQANLQRATLANVVLEHANNSRLFNAPLIPSIRESGPQMLDQRGGIEHLREGLKAEIRQRRNAFRHSAPPEFLCGDVASRTRAPLAARVPNLGELCVRYSLP